MCPLLNSQKVSPGVFIEERDFSAYTEETSSNNVCFLGFAPYGPINEVREIRNQSQLFSVFGEPDCSVNGAYLHYAAIAYLKRGNGLNIIRVADTESGSATVATYGTVNVPDAGYAATFTTATASPAISAVPTYTQPDVSTGYFSNSKRLLSFCVNGTYNYSFVFDWTTEAIGAKSLSQYVYDSVKNQYNAKTVPFNIAMTDDGKLELTSKSISENASIKLIPSIGGLQELFVANNNSAVEEVKISTAPIVTADFMEATKVATLSIKGTGVKEWDNKTYSVTLPIFSGVLADYNEDLQDAVNKVCPGIVAKIVKTGTGETEAYNFEFTAGWEAGSAIVPLYGAQVEMTVAFATVGMFADANAKSVTQKGSADVTVVGSSTGKAGGNLLTVTAKYPGTLSSDISVQFYNDIKTNSLDVSVIYKGKVVEQYINMDVNDFNSVYFIERYINKTSSYIQVKRNVTADYTVNGNYGAKDGTYALTAGTNGVPNDPDLMSEIIVGDSFELTGMQLLMDKELVSVDIIAVPGVSSPSVIAAMQSVCDKRQDCMFIVDPPYGLRATEVEMWSLGAHALNSATFDTDRGALYWPWIKMYDIYANDELELPPSGSICAVYAQNDSIGKPWTAPAGEKRGQMDWITGLCHRATSDERDQLYGGSNCINVISQFTGQSAVVWGQKTMQRSKSAFDRVNVRRLFDYVAKEIKKISRPYIFEPHTMFTRNSYKSALENMLGQVLSGQGVSEYKVICDETINTPETIDRNELRCLIAIKPVKAIEFVYVTVTANRTDVSFEILEQ